MQKGLAELKRHCKMPVNGDVSLKIMNGMRTPARTLLEIADAYEEESSRILDFIRGTGIQVADSKKSIIGEGHSYSEVDDVSLPDSPGKQDYVPFSYELYLEKTALGIERCLSMFRSGDFLEIDVEFDHIDTYLVNLLQEDQEAMHLDILRDFTIQASEVASHLDQYREPEILQPDVIVELNEHLMGYIAQNPDLLYSVSPRLFEEIIGEIFRKFGCNVTLTKRTRDGGYDILAVEHNDYGTNKFIIECKRYSATRKIGVGIVRKLYGTKVHSLATKAFLVTTSSFTKTAMDFQKQHLWEMELKDFRDIRKWLSKNWKTEG